MKQLLEAIRLAVLANVSEINALSHFIDISGEAKRLQTLSKVNELLLEAAQLVMELHTTSASKED